MTLNPPPFVESSVERLHDRSPPQRDLVDKKASRLGAWFFLLASCWTMVMAVVAGVLEVPCPARLSGGRYVRGAISISVPWAASSETVAATRSMLLLTCGGVWAVGLLELVFS